MNAGSIRMLRHSLLEDCLREYCLSKDCLEMS